MKQLRNIRTLTAWIGLLGLVLTLSLRANDSKDAKAEKPAPKGYYDVESPQAASILKRFPKLIILDIRTPREYAAGHLKGAKNIDFFEDNFAAEIGKLDPKKGYLVHCASGGRSGKSMKTFKEKGFTTVYHIADGYKGWVAAKLPTVKE